MTAVAPDFIVRRSRLDPAERRACVADIVDTLKEKGATWGEITLDVAMTAAMWRYLGGEAARLWRR